MEQNAVHHFVRVMHTVKKGRDENTLNIVPTTSDNCKAPNFTRDGTRNKVLFDRLYHYTRNLSEI